MLTFTGSTENDPRVMEWIADHQGESGRIAVGWFTVIRQTGAELPDPSAILEGSGKRMRHVKVKVGKEIDPVALEMLINEAYIDIQQRVKNDG